MKRFEKYIDAENYAKEVSARELRPISIVHLYCAKTKKWGGNKDFTVMDTKDEWYYGINHVMLITNFETPFKIIFTSPKSGGHTEYFPTEEKQKARLKEIRDTKYFSVLYVSKLTSEQYFEECIKPYERSNQMVEEHRKTLMEI